MNRTERDIRSAFEGKKNALAEDKTVTFAGTVGAPLKLKFSDGAEDVFFRVEDRPDLNQVPPILKKDSGFELDLKTNTVKPAQIRYTWDDPTWRSGIRPVFLSPEDARAYARERMGFFGPLQITEHTVFQHDLHIESMPAPSSPGCSRTETPSEIMDRKQEENLKAILQEKSAEPLSPWKP